MSQPWQRVDPPPEGVPARPPFDIVWRATFPRVWRMLWRLGISWADREDLAQDVYEVVVRRLDTYDPTRSLTAWVLSITWHTATRHRRRFYVQQEQLASDAINDPPDPAPDPEQHAAAAEVCRLVDNLLQTLGDVPRAIVYLHDFEGLGMPDIASALEIPETTGYTHLRRGRKAFQAAVQRLSPRERAALGVRMACGAVVPLFPIDLAVFFAAERQLDADAAMVEAQERLGHRFGESARRIGGGGGGGGSTAAPAMGRMPSFSPALLAAALLSPAQLVGAGLFVLLTGAAAGAAVYANLQGSPYEGGEPMIIAARDVIFEAATAGPVASAPGVAAATPSSAAPTSSTSAAATIPVAPSSTAPASASAGASPGDTEGGLLYRARAAVKAGNPIDAIKHLQRHEKKYPNGRMRQERETIWIQALALDNRPGEAADRARRFREGAEKSVLQPGVDAAVRPSPNPRVRP